MKNALVYLSVFLVGVAWIMAEYARERQVPELLLFSVVVGVVAIISLFFLALRGGK